MNRKSSDKRFGAVNRKLLNLRRLEALPEFPSITLIQSPLSVLDGKVISSMIVEKLAWLGSIHTPALFRIVAYGVC